jgi:hypothetical protein
MRRILIAATAVFLAAAPGVASASCGLTDFDCLDREYRLDRLEQGQRDADWARQERQRDADFDRYMQSRFGQDRIR